MFTLPLTPLCHYIWRKQYSPLHPRSSQTRTPFPPPFFMAQALHPIQQSLRIIESNAHSDAWSLCIRIFECHIINNEDKRLDLYQEVSIKPNWNPEKATWCQKLRPIEKFISTHLERNCPFQDSHTHPSQLCRHLGNWTALLRRLKDLSLYPCSSLLFFSS